MRKTIYTLIAYLAISLVSSAEFTVDSLRKDVAVMVNDLNGINKENAKLFIRSYMPPAVVANLEKSKKLDSLADRMATDVAAKDQLLRALKLADFTKAAIDDKAKSLVIPSENVPSKKMTFLFIEKKWYIGN